MRALGRNQTAALVALLDAGDEARRRTPSIGFAIRASAQSAASTLKRLERRGLVRRPYREPGEALCVWTDVWELTPAGREIAKSTPLWRRGLRSPEAEAGLVRVAGRLPVEKLADLAIRDCGGLEAAVDWCSTWEHRPDFKLLLDELTERLRAL